MKTLSASLLAGCVAWAASAGEVRFSAGPTAAKAADKTAISFTVSAPTDVEVAVLDGKGQVVRHLAAGVLGAKNPPPEPLKPGLSQTLEWDGKDDLGNPPPSTVHPPPFRVQVRAGMGVKFGRLIGGSPYTGAMAYWSARDSVAVDDQGKLYVKMASYPGPHWSHDLPWHVRSFDASGKYEREVLPHGPSTPAEKATTFYGRIPTPDGLLTPVNGSALLPCFQNLGHNLHHRAVDGSLVFVRQDARRMVDGGWQNVRQEALVFYKLDGSNVLRTVPIASSPEKFRHPAWLVPRAAFSPDGKFAYYANAASCLKDKPQSPKDVDPAWPDGRVYRQDISKAGCDPEKFYDLELPDWEKAKYPLPSNEGGTTSAPDADVDAQGNVLVCDLASEGIVEVSPDGRKLSFTRVPGPGRVVVGRKSGALYVLSSVRKPGARQASQELVKIVGRGADAKVAARMPVTFQWGAFALAVDESGAAPAVWLQNQYRVTRVEDRGASFAVTTENLVNSDKGAVTFMQYLAVDPEAELVYVSTFPWATTGERGNPLLRYSGETGEGGRTGQAALDVAVGPGGTVYLGGTGSYSGPIRRFSRDLKPLPFAGGRNEFGDMASRYGRGDSSGGLAADLKGQLFVYQSIGGNWPECAYAYDAEGKRVDHPRKLKDGGHDEGKRGLVPVLVGPLSPGGGIRVDSAGNVYVGQRWLPKGHVPPAGFEKDAAYRNGAGTILKFGPTGGERPGDWRQWKPELPMGFSGVLRTYSDYGVASGAFSMGGANACICTRSRFDLDRYDRLYVPSPITFKVSVRDNSDNEILRFGGYGNFDAQGPQSREPKPEIPFGWPTAVGASDRYIYVGDQFNHRVVRADKTWAAEAVCPVGP